MKNKKILVDIAVKLGVYLIKKGLYEVIPELIKMVKEDHLDDLIDNLNLDKDFGDIIKNLISSEKSSAQNKKRDPARRKSKITVSDAEKILLNHRKSVALKGRESLETIQNGNQNE
jgi:hypothetical protein